MPKANSIVITAHGKIDKSIKTSLPYTIITSCKLGETHHGSHLNFSDLSMFTNRQFLNNLILNGNDDYTNQGEVLLLGAAMPQINLRPCANGEYIKKWSWQKPYIIEYFKKMFIYELKDLPSNPYGINYLTMAERMSTLSLTTLKKFADESQNFKLSSHVNILSDYEQATTHVPIIAVAPNHAFSITPIPSSGIYVFDYEASKAAEVWPL